MIKVGDFSQQSDSEKGLGNNNFDTFLRLEIDIQHVIRGIEDSILYLNNILMQLKQLINHQIINSRKFDKSTQTGRYLQSRPIIPNKMGNICPGFQQQLINNTFLTSNYKFAGLAKTSSVYFTRGVR